MKSFTHYMRCIVIFSMIFLPAFIASGQSPNSMSYQAVIRNSNNELVVNSQVGMRVTILEGSATGTAVYSQTSQPTSNANGLVSIEIGGDTDFSAIDWSQGIFFIKTETDPVYVASQASHITAGDITKLGNLSGINTGDQDLSGLATQTALEDTASALRRSMTNIDGSIFTETDPVFTASVAKGIATTDTAHWNAAYRWGNHAAQGYIKNTSSTETGDLMYYDGGNWISKKLTVSSAGGALPIEIMQPYLVLNYCIALNGIFPSRSSTEPFVGEIELFGFNFAPTGYAMCNGQLMPISQNTALFSLLGVTYGGNGVNTFALPDLRGRTPVHFGQGPGLSDRTLGESAGSEQIILQFNQMPIHTHTIVYE